MAAIDESDDDWEEDEQLVVVELSGLIDGEALKCCPADKAVFLGPEEEHPILRLDKHIFSCKYEDYFGSAMIFEEQVDQDGKSQLTYKCHTNKKLNAVPISVKPKEDKNSHEEETQSPESNLETTPDKPSLDLLVQD